MNNKNKLGVLVCLIGLMTVLLANAQSAFKADGLVESTAGGFKFPDGSLQATAYANTESYNEDSVCEEVITLTEYRCYFDVPPGKILEIEKVSGFSRSGNAQILFAQGTIGPEFETLDLGRDSYLIPTTATFTFSGAGEVYFFEASGPVYLGSHDVYLTSSGVRRDYRIEIKTDGSRAFTETIANVTGRLSPEIQ